MTHPNFVTNGASLEDCHTNFFALADLCGIRWRRLALADNLLCTPQQPREPLDDPVLTSYTKCLAADLLCVWRRVVKSTSSATSLGDGQQGSSSGTNNTRPDQQGPPQATFTKELWIFWYGKEPDLNEFVSSELSEIEQGTWENGLSYECRTLLFKAFHNLIERCLLSRGFARFGRWFVQPSTATDKSTSRTSSSTSASSSSANNRTQDNTDSKSNLTVAFNFFVHGESTVCASIDVRQHPPVFRISKRHVSAAQGMPNGLNVILAPYGISGMLTGQAFKENDPLVQRLLSEWKQFYPINQSPKESASKPRQSNAPFHIDLSTDSPATCGGGTSVNHSDSPGGDDTSSNSMGSGSQLPQVVEVIVAGTRMKYPSSYVYVTSSHLSNNINNSTAACDSTSNVKTESTLFNRDCTTSITQPTSTSSLLTPPNSPPEQLDLTTIDSNKLKSPQLAPLQPVHPSMGYLLRDSVNQDMIASKAAEQKHNSSLSTSAENLTSTTTSTTAAKWEFLDPCSKTACFCYRCKVSKKGANNLNMKSGANTPGSTSNSGNKNKENKNEKMPKMIKGPAFHRRSLSADALFDIESIVGNNKSSSTSLTIANVSTVSTSQSTTTGAQQPPSVQPKTPSLSYKSPLGPGGLPSIASNATTPGGNGLDSPRSAAPSVSNDGPPSTNPEQSLPSVSPHPSARSDADSQLETIPGRSPATTAPQREKSQLEQLLSPYPTAVSSVKAALSAGSPALTNHWTPSAVPTDAESTPITNNTGLSSVSNDGQGIKRPTLSVGHEDDTKDRFGRNSQLYDYSSLYDMSESWDLPKPKRRRAIYTEDPSNDPMNNFMNSKPKDPYEFDDFDGGDPFGNKSKSDTNKNENGTNNGQQQMHNSNVNGGRADELAMNGGGPDGTSNGNANNGSNGRDSSVLSNTSELSVTSPLKSREFTRVDDLVPSLCDLDHIFDNSSGEDSSDQLSSSLKHQHQNGQMILANGQIEKIATSKTKNNTSNGNNTSSTASNQTNCPSSISSIHALPELCRMFPTPPSLEQHHTAPSPNEGGFLDDTMKCDIYPSSPYSLEHLKDSSYVYKPPVQSIFIASAKYSPLADIPSTANLPTECVYKLTVSKNSNIFQQPPPSSQQQNIRPVPPKSSGYVHQQPGQLPPPGLHNALMHQRSMAPPQHYGPNSNMMPNRMPMSGIRPPNHFGGMSPHPMHGGPPQHMQQQHASGNTPNQFPFMQDQRMVNANMYSPHHGPPSVEMNHHAPSPFGQFSNTHGGQPSPRAIGAHMSPMGGPASVNAITPFDGASFMPGSNHRTAENVANNSTPAEANSLLINLALSDSLMNLFKDHNFESCTLCVCNMNLKGGDVGVYLPDALIPGISDESQYKCTCGFSAVVNRHRSALAGLFYEDEVEITGVVYDPVEDMILKPFGGSGDTKEATSSNAVSLVDELNQNLVDLIRTQCSTLLSSCSLLSKSLSLEITCNSFAHKINPSQIALTGLKMVSKSTLANSPQAVFRSDSCELTYFALKSGKTALDSYPQKTELQQWADKRVLKGTCLHQWQFVETEVPVNNLDTLRYMREIQPLLQAAVQRSAVQHQANNNTGSHHWEVTYTVAGPLTWRQFHRLAGRGTEDQCEPQPIPSLLVGHERDWVSVSPFALKYWEKLPLEPYSVPRDVAYLVIAPNHQQYLSSHLRTFFKELSATYELLRLGKHAPIVQVLRDGILKVPPSNKSEINEEIDEWFNKIGDSDVAAKLKLYAHVCKGYMLALVSNLKLDKTIFDSQKPATPTKAEQAQSGQTSHLGPTSISSGLYQSKSSSDQHNSYDKNNMNDDSNSDGPSNGLPSFSTMAQQENEEDDPTRQPAIVIYMVEPFTLANLDKETYRLACLGLLRCYTMVFNVLPDNIKKCINLQIVSLDSILASGNDFRGCSRQEQLKSLSFAVYTQSRKSPLAPHICKSLTGFGPAASLDTFLKDQIQRNPTTAASPRLYAPPYVLAPLKDKNTELGHMFGDQREKTHNMFVSYCLTDDQRWIVGSCANERGDLLESTLINIEVPNRLRRRKATVRRYGLQKLMEFILQVMSDSTRSWRLIVGRLGRVGHGELREWSSLLSKKALLRYSKNVKDPCTQCKNVCSHEIPLILSACFISLEADTALRVLSDQYTPDDRFSSSCNTCALSTPEDASCTHILTFPTSTTMQSSQGTFQMDPIGMGSMGDDDLLNAFGDADTGDLGVDDGIGGLFDWGDPDDPMGATSPGMDGGHGMGGGMHPDSPSSRQIGFDNSSSKLAGVLGDVPDEPSNLLQQPLALGYYVSTAPTGTLPKWFWSSAPHLKNSRPSFLKSALLIHIPSVHNINDDLLQSNNNKNYHPLDSNLTTDVLRYVLEGYNSLSWLSLDPATHDRTSCLPVHIQTMLQLYHTVQALT